MISKPFSVRGRTSSGDKTPWVRMDAASSCNATGSKVWRGLVFDSFRTDKGTLRYSVALTIWVSMMTGSFRAVEGEGTERQRAFTAPRGRGLAEDALVREGFEKALQAQGVVPCLSKPLMLLLKLRQRDIVAVDDGS